MRRRFARWRGPGRLRRFARGERGSATVEFAIVVPLVLTLFLSSVDFGVVMLRQVFLDRAVDIAVRDIRLGRVSNNGHDQLRDAICDRTHMLPNCRRDIAIELRPIDTESFAGLDGPAQCVDRAEDINPVLEFNPARGQQELMLIRVCVVSDPFLRVTGMVLGMSLDDSGGYNVVARSAFANEPA